jgi:hypothetical protein
MFTKLLICCGLALQVLQTDAFSMGPYPLKMRDSGMPVENSMNRRVFTNFIGASTAVAFVSSSLHSLPSYASEPSDDNRPLTKAEMEEYNKLLEEAKRIQNIIDMNKKAAEQDMLQNKDEFRRNLLKKLFGNVFEK